MSDELSGCISDGNLYCTCNLSLVQLGSPKTLVSINFSRVFVGKRGDCSKIVSEYDQKIPQSQSQPNGT